MFQLIPMETDRVQRQWQTVMEVAVAMKKEGIDTGDAVRRLRDAKVLLNHCIYDEHAHGEELFEAEKEIAEIQGILQSILDRAGKRDRFSFDSRPKKDKKTVGGGPLPSGLQRGAQWLRINLAEGVDPDRIAGMEGVNVVERDDKSIVITGDRDALSRAVKEISKVFRG